MPPKSQTYPGVSATRRRTRMKTNAGGVDHLREMRIRRNRKKRNALNLKFLFEPKKREPTIRQAKEAREKRLRMRAPPDEPYNHMKYARLKKECNILSIKIKDLNQDEPEESKRERLLKALRRRTERHPYCLLADGDA